jgi:hypothetical protein
MPTPAQVEIEALHAAYCAGTGFDLPLDSAREMQWWEVYRRGIRAGDIAALIRYMKWKKGKDLPVRSLLFRSFVANPDYLEEDLAELRARQRSAPARQAQRTERAAVLQASGREAAPAPPAAKTAAQILEEQRLLDADFEALKAKIARGEDV